jgi:hypothetical protein
MHAQSILVLAKAEEWLVSVVYYVVLGGAHARSVQ